MMSDFDLRLAGTVAARDGISCGGVIPSSGFREVPAEEGADALVAAEGADALLAAEGADALLAAVGAGVLLDDEHAESNATAAKALVHRAIVLWDITFPFIELQKGSVPSRCMELVRWDRD